MVEEPGWHAKGSLPPEESGRLRVADLFGREVLYRDGTSDVNVLREVLFRRCYRRVGLGFDVYPGEHWLDLGANVGAFAVYCLSRGATAECYEPDASCYGLLARNADGCVTHRAAVTASRDRVVSFRVPAGGVDFSRGAVDPGGSMVVANTLIGDLAGPYDGVKMDIEGAEHAILDAGVLPSCRKLVLEYHLSRDDDLDALGRRLAWLKRRFGRVAYPPELDRLAAARGRGRSYFDRLVFCVR
jgi:FkbM family methyltransferase